jgi:hypothetical protein
LIFILDSTHGTFINKNRIRPKTYVRIKVGHQIKLGNSTRAYILVGPSDDEEEQSELTVTEIIQQKLERERLAQEAQLESKKILEKKEEEGISWGMSVDDDPEEEPDLTENPFAVTNNEELFIHDPKKTLRGFFEREGHDLEYRCDELSPGVFICRVDLPIDDEFGKSMVCEVQHKGKKKECVVQCALEACRILDRHGYLRKANHEPRRIKKTNDSDDSDDDTFFDRTGDVEKRRMKKLEPAQQEVYTYDQLKAQEKELLTKIENNESKLQIMIEMEKRQKKQNEDDEDLDTFMSHLSHDKIDKFGIRNTKLEIQNMKIELTKVQKLINIAKPSIDLPSLSLNKGKLPLYGKRNKLPKYFGVKRPTENESTKERTVQNEELTVEEEEKEDPKAKIKDESNEHKLPQKESFFVEKESKLFNNEPAETEKIEKSQAKGNDEIVEEPPKKILKIESVPATSYDESKKSPVIEQSKSKKSRTFKSRDRYRANVDMNDDDEYIDEGKIAFFVPPTNQSGDGTTHLNEKFGY